MKKTYAILLSIFALITIQAQENKFNLFIGTYTNPCESKGIYVYEFDVNSGEFNFKNATENIINPSYLSVSSDNKFVYSVTENSQKKNGAVSFKYNSRNGKLDVLNFQEAKAEGSCYIINDDKNVITANYSSGSISVFGKNNDGSLTEVKQVIQHFGPEVSGGINTKRQESPHVHIVYFSPDKKYVLANDLGNDKVYIYQYNPNGGNEILKLKSTVSVNPGGGPRHLTFSENGKFVYVLQELDGKVAVFSYSNGTLKKIDESSVLSKDFKGTFTAADIHISPDGKFLYATNRKEANDISIFKILKNGKLKFEGRNSTLGDGPRNFAIDSTGNFLLVAHQYTNDIVIFKRNKITGSLTDTGKKIELCSPVCLVFTKI